jgi:endonuclease G
VTVSRALGTCLRFALLFAAVDFLQCSGSGGVGLPLTAPAYHAEEPRPTARPLDRATPLTGSVHLVLGVPRDADPSDDHLLDEGSFVLSYSPVKRVPNWVAWRLDRSYLGRVRRTADFRPDLLLPARLYRVNDSDYLHSGYDRGHMCPSADRTATKADNKRTFLFTNIAPQLHELNAGPWEGLEEYVRQRARAGEVTYVVAGGVFEVPFRTIGNGVVVPAANFKIVAFLHEGQGVKDVDGDTPLLAALMPNRPGVGEHDWSEYLTSVDAIEQATGYDFLSAVPEPIQRVIEARVSRR